MTTEQKDSWNEWAKFVLEELKNLRGDLKSMEEKNEKKMAEFWKMHVEVQEKISALKTQAAILGALVGTAGGTIAQTVINAVFK